SSANEDVMLHFLSIEGKLLMMQKLDKSSTIDVSSYEAGLYILVFRSKTKTESHRIQILH
ncbi:MAG: T9SS C-terminal target domain-containing protein, partial [Chitinophagia bacterium]|nr:T9SS C-terminal target domain-containing protein [Chitinophagia bacterium]